MELNSNFPVRMPKQHGRLLVQNHLLKYIDVKSTDQLAVELESVDLELDAVLHEPHKPIEHVYFPHGSVISLMSAFENKSMHLGCYIGNDGLLGAALALNANTSSCRAVVKIPGVATRMTAQTFNQVLQRSETFRNAVLRYAQVQTDQISQTFGCYCVHEVEERLATLLLTIKDRVCSNDFTLKHTDIAEMIGRHRPTVTLAARSLKKRKLIDYSYRHISIINEVRLQSIACDCYSPFLTQFFLQKI